MSNVPSSTAPPTTAKLSPFSDLSVDERIRLFCSQQREWLEQELRSEQDAAISDESNSTVVSALSNLECLEVSVGLYGRTVVTLGPLASFTDKPPAATKGGKAGGTATRLPAHRFTSGDPVEIQSKPSGGNSKKTCLSGVVSQVTESSLSIALVDDDEKTKIQAAAAAATATNSTGAAEVDASLPHSWMTQQPSPSLAVVASRSIQVHQKYLQALTELERQGVSHPVAGNVVQCLFGTPTFQSAGGSSPSNGNPFSSSSKMSFFNTNLDASQQEAVAFGLNPHADLPVACIHGPPGTGKTTTLVELVRQAVWTRNSPYKRILVVAPSNVAVDNILTKLVQPQAAVDGETTPSTSKGTPALRVVRLGHPARLQPGILPYSLEAQVQVADGTDIVRQVRKELQDWWAVLAKNNNSKNKKKGNAANNRRTAYREIKLLKQEIRRREESVVQDLLSSAHVVLATCVGAANHVLQRQKRLSKDPEAAASKPFDLVVIDEAAQSLEVACWIPALLGTRLILAGDHHQLPPTVQSTKVQSQLSYTLFERVLDWYLPTADARTTTKVSSSTESTIDGNSRVSRMLKVQYRMHQNIADWASHATYGGLLRTPAHVADRSLEPLLNSRQKHVSKEATQDAKKDGVSNAVIDTSSFGPLVWIDTAGCDLVEDVTSGGSRFNMGEAELVRQHVQSLLASRLAPHEIAVITPYNGQVQVLRTLLLDDENTNISNKLEIRTVDGFQGGERDAVVLSLVRSSNTSGRGEPSIGFLRDNRRLNVAITRARRHVCIIADSETVQQSALIRNLYEWTESNGQLVSAMELLPTQAATTESMASPISCSLVDAEELKPSSRRTTESKRDQTQSKESIQQAKQERIADLQRQVHEFAATGQPGDTLPLHAELNRNDRRLVHELAEQLGLLHSSEGAEGINRRLTLRIPPNDRNLSLPAGQGSLDPKDHPSMAKSADNQSGKLPSNEATSSAFAALQHLDDEDSDEEKDGTIINETKQTGPSVSEPPLNSLLSSLAQERKDRENLRNVSLQASTEAALPLGVPKTNKKTSRKGKGQKLGGNKKSTACPPPIDPNGEMDDMAFLDAQIAQVQSSHGRKIDGKGSYKTVINGILIAKPAPHEPKRDERASANLRCKLKKAQDERKSKSKKK